MRQPMVVIGEILVEIMADETGDGFREALALRGPYPSGAPAIFIDQAARMGAPCAIISTVGDDDFGQLNLDRLRQDGVDVSAVNVDPELPTGSAFVRYRPDGNRDFVFNLRHAACGQIPSGEAVERVLANASHLHIMGSSLSSPPLTTLNLKAANAIKSRGGTVSFDPNLRPEILSDATVATSMQKIMALTDLFLPSGDELWLLTDAKEATGAAAELLSKGIQAIVHKQGATGASYYDRENTLFVPAFSAQEVDPTGAGDCFGGTFTALWLAGTDNTEALTMAAAAGALAVSKRGPMEGASTPQILKTFISQNPRQQ